ncbi:hypothetical protein OG230_20105 [Streptomyces sp. NBC_00234]|uniref:hypothetical protein n=1 Tax=Streptomyces sp. NBC_00234 TaxID=2903638 RepID=UPI002E2812EB|nr:hypothetical protein [Streptomyces sp. NBC_00234]
MSTLRKAGVFAAAVTVCATSLVAAPHAFAGEGKAAAQVSAVKLSPRADAETRAIAKSQSAAVVAAANICGSTYELDDAKPLPNSTTRHGTLFFYSNAGATSACAILDNNTPGSANYMDLRIWAGDNTGGADIDKGSFSEYAGPVYSSTAAAGGRCVGLSALMKNEAGTSNLINWKGGYIFSASDGSECL